MNPIVTKHVQGGTHAALVEHVSTKYLAGVGHVSVQHSCKERAFCDQPRRKMNTGC